MDVIPAVDMKGGECVQLVQGDEGTAKTYGDPVESARRWVDEGAEHLHVVDLDGAIDGERRNASQVRRIVEETDVSVQVGGGVRSVGDARTLFEAGADRVVMGTAAVENPPLVGRAAEYGEVVVSLDAREGEVVVEGWKEGAGVSPVEVARRFEDEGASAFLFTNVDDEGLLEGVTVEPVEELVEAVDVPVIASGGVATTDDVKALREAGASGVVIGTAFYEGRMSYDEANEVAT
ncbi:1-(5-phosphoribosyl)-5-[(5-phosphoribosylamino)methylideneamino]imidazole-4-carboxamide isomerase [Haladaptatus sp. F3-133]|jgi:phosphoribosylformimino-5-aminoimidazole carboxamide ribotide isomerase|uniref:1-(5-phosphoribosyl)-5-[(5-phosphoribosylamino)methylideneamino] imidazole-4-carboxamide isomerase n=1 Tax=Halorutilus salinus TaxID=2487751 RepID=A0A9Q4GH86_9EURY|nr:1-(5-phosphoribosyl)-5-[(5-phosphoribosylamino)methylideneamino]imidazole-4-carboxamide isomerase [Halorutilus salinus]MCX2819577.1 1-(5-phosphoribosyl)-5-[(5-phosphoribosylamino)methylideneamino]imidazole-4-carboxamide isomerase [Halorutilus salinus]